MAQPHPIIAGFASLFEPQGSLDVLIANSHVQGTEALTAWCSGIKQRFPDAMHWEGVHVHHFCHPDEGFE
jgi:hypothetical protein